MTGATPSPALRNPPLAFDVEASTAASRPAAARDASATLKLSLHGDFAAIEAEWRRFERSADCTPFQTFDWLFAWQRHIGEREGVRPVIAVASLLNGETAFMLPLGVETQRLARRLCWLGQDLNDYNAPLIASEFSQCITPERFRAAWKALCARIRHHPGLHYDWIELEKMPQIIGSQVNPFFHLALAANPSGAHIGQLGTDWKTFYYDKRSSATRRRDRVKHKHLSQFGEISFASSADAGDSRHILETLMEQKSRLLAQRGIADMFARPGWREFFLDVAANPATRDLVHVSRVQIGATCAAANLGVVLRDTYYHVLASYDNGAVAQYGPGALHLRELLAYAIGLGLKRFDFTIGDEAYKLEWSDTHVRLGDYTAAATWRGWLPYCRSLVRRPVKRFIKQTPWAWRAASRLRCRFGSILRRS